MSDWFECVTSIKQPLPGGGFKRYEAGVKYPRKEIDDCCFVNREIKDKEGKVIDTVSEPCSSYFIKTDPPPPPPKDEKEAEKVSTLSPAPSSPVRPEPVEGQAPKKQPKKPKEVTPNAD